MKGEITRRMERVENDIQSLFTNLYCKKDFLYLLVEAKNAMTDRRPFVLKKLAQKLNNVGISCEYGKSFAYYKKIVMSSDIPDNTSAVNKKLIGALRDIYSAYPRPKEFMGRIVDLLDPDSIGRGSLKLRILRRFMKTVNVEDNKKYYSETLASKDIYDVDESIFDNLDEASKTKKDYAPLAKAAYNLAEGNFISPTTTKEQLFLFAFAYDMRYYVSVDADDYVLRKDVEKHLFEDYYCDNLTRYLYLEDGGKSGNSDKEPSGVGLNPKNFIDVTFIYYLNKEGLSASQRVSGFYNTVNKVKNAWKNEHEYIEAQKSVFENIPTAVYQQKIDTVISGLDEESFANYLIENYYCDVRYNYIGNSGELQIGYKGLFELQFAINSAYAQYADILALIKSLLNLPENAELAKINSDTVKNSEDDEFAYGVYLNENKFELKRNVLSTDLECFEFDVAEGQNEFLAIIKNIEKRLSLEQAFAADQAIEVTRTKLIAAYYHYYCLENGSDDRENRWRSFQDVYDDFSSCINSYLADAGFQKINAKNLYDVFVIFFAYCKINNFLH